MSGCEDTQLVTERPCDDSNTALLSADPEPEPPVFTGISYAATDNRHWYQESSMHKRNLNCWNGFDTRPRSWRTVLMKKLLIKVSWCFMREVRAEK